MLTHRYHAIRRLIQASCHLLPNRFIAWTDPPRERSCQKGIKPGHLIRDNDTKYGDQVARVAVTSQIEVLGTLYSTPRANPICERFLGSVRRECLDHILIVHQRHLGRVLREYVDYYNHARPHQGIDQTIPLGSPFEPREPSEGRVVSVPLLSGLHRDYHRAA